MTPRQEYIMEVWDEFDYDDYSTELVMSMVKSVAECSHDELMAALHASGTMEEVK